MEKTVIEDVVLYGVDRLKCSKVGTALSNLEESAQNLDTGSHTIFLLLAVIITVGAAVGLAGLK